MLALAYSLLLFAYWTLIGRALIAVVYPRFGVLRAVLLAPAVGLSVSTLSVMACNQAGIAIRDCAVPLTMGWTLVAAVTLLITRPQLPGRAAAPFFLAAVAAVGWAGWPAVEAGFNWVSYANDDMANYCLAAQRFLDHGFYHVPSMNELGGRNYPSYFFFMHVSDMMRFGAEHTVAWMAGLAGLKPTQAFMPVILALGLVQLFAACGLALHRGRDRRLATVTAVLLAFSPLFMLGMLYQLIAQVGGVALLLATLALLLRHWVSERRRVFMRYAVLPGVTAAALCIFYPEVTPFAALTVLGFAGLAVVRDRAMPRGLIGLVAYTLVAALVLLRHNFIGYVIVFIGQAGSAMQEANLLLSLFPYFMVPTGFSNLYGWMPLAHDFPEPVLSVSIAAGIAATIALCAAAARGSWRRTPIALLFLLQFLVAVRLFYGVNDFGVYKLAMWMQPAIAALLAVVVLRVARSRPHWTGLLVALFVVSTLPTGWYYTHSSRGVEAGGLTELRMASQTGIAIKPPGDTPTQLIATAENVVAAKFAASETQGHGLALVSRDFFHPVIRTDYKDPIWPIRAHPEFEVMNHTLPLLTARSVETIRESELWKTRFTQPVMPGPASYYVTMDPRLSLFNKLNPPVGLANNDSVFTLVRPEDVNNYLVFVHSGLGNHYYLGDRRRIALFQQERDVYVDGGNFNAVGRFLLLRVENPTPRIYLRVAATRTMLAGRTAWNPGAVIRAAQDTPLGAVGDGAFNLFVGPLEPKAFEGAHYLAIDFAEFPYQTKDYRSGLKRLYNQKVPMDYRRLVGWARDISAVSEAEYESLHRPRSVSQFPADLAQAHGLEFSGLYEDGWVSPRAKLVLGQAIPGATVRLSGMVPEVAGTTAGTAQLEVRINGRKAAELPLRLGRFDWLVPVPASGPTTAIELIGSASFRLPGRDQRPVLAKLEQVAIEEPGETVAYTYPRHGSPVLATDAVDNDGWAAAKATLHLPPANVVRALELQLEYPTWGGAVATTLTARWQGSEQQIALAPGQRPTLRVLLPPATDPVALTLTTDARITLPAPDQRIRAYRVSEVRLAPANP